jgi:hypothetical protein
VQAIAARPQRAPDGAPVHYERHRPEQTTLYRLVQQHAATFISEAEAIAGAEFPKFVKDEFDAFLECGDCGHDKLVAFRCKRRGFCPSCGARRMAQKAAQLVEHVIPHVPVRQWVLSLPMPLRLRLAAQPKLVMPVLQVVHRMNSRHLLGQAGLKAEQAAACTYPHRLRSARRAEGLDGAGRHAPGDGLQAASVRRHRRLQPARRRALRPRRPPSAMRTASITGRCG